MSGSVVLIGFMGAGKSVVGAALAALTGLELADTDAIVERDAGSSVADIFAAEGEEGFRRREAAAVAEAASAGPRVIACGGGAVLPLHNYQALRAAGIIVYLRAPEAVLRERVAASGFQRPMLDEPGAFERLIAERTPAYEASADVVVDTAGRDPADLAAEIAAKSGLAVLQ